MSSHLGKQAVVVGAGMGGLTAARALADHFERVIVLENDALPSDATPRSGIPQGKHAHALLAGGQQALSTLFPSFEQDLVQAGAVLLRLNSDIRLERPGYDPMPQRDLGLFMYSASRPLIECTVRKQVARHGNIAIHERCRAQQFMVTSDGAAVTGVRCEHSDGKTENLPADLVIDASGHALLTLTLLESFGQAAPEETLIGVDIGYATAIFEIPNDAPPDWKAVFTLPHPRHDTRGVFFFPAEGNRWIVTLSGRYADKPPDDEAGFFNHARNLRTPTAYNAIKHAKRTSEFARYGFKASRRRHFERLASFPRGLLPFGDTVCRFNPVYGQGMSVAAQEACLLRRLLGAQAAESDGLATLASTFFTEVQAILETPWASAAIPDFLDPRTEGQRPPDLENILKFSGALFKIAAEDPAVHKVLMEVQHLLKPQSAYREPELARRVQAVMAEG
jgi:2-polyprenyl-6-methoxyphenol hydroxylase-like FAD-dependent oxidoreductase